MRTDRLYPDDVPTDIFQQVKILVVDKGMTLNDAIQEIEGKLYGLKIPMSIRDKLREESYRW